MHWRGWDERSPAGTAFCTSGGTPLSWREGEGRGEDAHMVITIGLAAVEGISI